MIAIALLAGLALAAAGLAIRLRRRRGAPRRGKDAAARGAQYRRLGYRYADELVFVQGTSIYTGVQLRQATGEFATRSEQMDLAMIPVSVYATLLGLFDHQSVRCQEMVRYRPVTTEGFVTQLLNRCWNPTDMFRTLVRKVAEHMKHATPQRMWVLILRLGDFPPGEQINPLGPLETMFTGVAAERIDPDLLARYHRQAELVHDTLARWADPLTRADLLWLIRKPLHGSIPVPEETHTPTRPWRGGHFEQAATLRADNPGWHLVLHKPDPDTDRPHTSYTATLVVTDDRPHTAFNARTAWGPRLARLDFPVEITWHYELIPAELNTKQVALAADNVFDEDADRRRAGAAEDPRFEARYAQAERFRNENLDDPKPGMIGRLRLTVSAPTPELLVRQIGAVRRAMGEVQVDRPEYGQLLLLEEQLPGGGVSDLGALSAGPAGGLKLWARRTDIYAPATGMLAVSTRLGDRVRVQRGRTLGWIGPLIAWTKSNGNPVHFDVAAQTARGDGAGIAIVGASGGGKSSLALLLFFWASESGVRCLVADPKVEFRNFALYIAFGNQRLQPGFMEEADAGTLGTPGSRFQPVNRQFWDDTEIIDLMAGPRGLFDPWRLTDTFAAGYDLAGEVIDIAFGREDHRAIARRALRQLHRQHKTDPAPPVGLADVIPHLETARSELHTDLAAARDNGNPVTALRGEIDAIDEVLARLDHGQTTPLLRLVLGRGTDPALPRPGSRRRTIFTMAGYQGADNPEQPETWTDTDRNAAVAMRMLLRLWRSTMTDRMVPNPVTGRPGRAPTAKFIDEGYRVTADPAGRNTVLVDLRQGRSYGSALIFIDQQPRGIAAIEKAGQEQDPETNQFATIFGFKQRSEAEARGLLQLMRGTINDLTAAELAEMTRDLTGEDQGGRLQTGECAMRDADGNLGVATVDQLFYVLARAAQTNHDLVGEDWAHDVPAGPAGWDINPEALDAVRTSILAEHNTDPDAAGQDDPPAAAADRTGAPAHPAPAPAPAP